MTRFVFYDLDTTGTSVTYAQALQFAAIVTTEQLPKTKLPPNALKEIYDAKARPALVGHYKMKGAPHLYSSNASSLDFPDTPCLYEWRGEKSLISENLIVTN